jgi:hypothetical protein
MQATVHVHWQSPMQHNENKEILNFKTTAAVHTAVIMEHSI